MESKYNLIYRTNTDTYNVCLCDTREEALYSQEKYARQTPHASGVFLISKIPGEYNDGGNVFLFENFNFRPEVDDDRKVYRVKKLVPEKRLLGEQFIGITDHDLIQYRMCSMPDNGPHCELTRDGGQYVSKYIDMLLFGVDGDVMAEFKYHSINQLKKRVANEGFGKVWESLPEGDENVVS